MSYANASGRNVLDHYGPRTTTKKFGGEYSTGTAVKMKEWVFDYDDLPVGGSTNLQSVIPANARIISAKFEVLTAFTSTSTTTDLLVGLEQGDGTDIDLDGLLTAANLTQTVIAVVGGVTTGTGALVGKTVGAAAGELIVTGSAGDLLTGRARVLVEYVEAGI